jgi:hypothetical protein
MAKVTICDPPSGWKYGFPRVVPQEVMEALKAARPTGNTTAFTDWLVSCGYPQSLIESFGDHFYCRYWEQEEDEQL